MSNLVARFVKLGDVIGLTNLPEDNFRDHLPKGIYELQMQYGPGEPRPVLRPDRDSFNIPAKLYGQHEEYKKILLGDFKKHKTGIMSALLAGEKGNGKSIFSEDICNQLLAQGLPVLIIRQAFPIDVLRHVLIHIGACVVVFDEFEKIYPFFSPSQHNHGNFPNFTIAAEFLQLLTDKVFQRTLMMYTVNEVSMLPPQFYNRPGRIRFLMNFKNPTEKDVALVLTDSKLPEFMHDFLTGYFISTRDNQSFDTLMQITELAKSTETLADLQSYMRVLNAPAMWMGNFRVPHHPNLISYQHHSSGGTSIVFLDHRRKEASAFISPQDKEREKAVDGDETEFPVYVSGRGRTIRFTMVNNTTEVVSFKPIFTGNVMPEQTEEEKVWEQEDNEEDDRRNSNNTPNWQSRDLSIPMRRQYGPVGRGNTRGYGHI